LIEEQFHLQLGRQLGLDTGQGLPHAPDHVQRRGPLTLEDGHQHGPPAVAADDVGLYRVAVAYVGDVLDVDRNAVDRLDRDVVEGRDQVGAAVELDVVLGGPHLRGAGRDDEVLVGDRGADIVGGQAAGVQGVQVEIDHDLALLAAPGLGHPRPLDRAESLDDEVGGVVEDLLLGQRIAGDGDLDDGHAGGAVADDVGRRDAGRHDLQERLTGGRDLRLGLGERGPGLEVDADDADAVERLTLDVLDVVDRRRQDALVDEDDPCLDLVGGHAAVLPDHADDGDVNLREDVGGHAVDTDRAEDGNQQRHHHERVGAPQCQPNNPHHVPPGFFRRAGRSCK